MLGKLQFLFLFDIGSMSSSSNQRLHISNFFVKPCNLSSSMLVVISLHFYRHMPWSQAFHSIVHDPYILSLTIYRDNHLHILLITLLTNRCKYSQGVKYCTRTPPQIEEHNWLKCSNVKENLCYRSLLPVYTYLCFIWLVK